MVASVCKIPKVPPLRKHFLLLVSIQHLVVGKDVIRLEKLGSLQVSIEIYKPPFIFYLHNSQQSIFIYIGLKFKLQVRFAFYHHQKLEKEELIK